MVAISFALGVAAWFGESKLWKYAFFAAIGLFVLVFVASLFKRKR